MEFILSLDPRVLWVIGGVALVLGILAIVRKAIKLAVSAVLVCVLMTYGGTMLEQVKQDFNVELNGTTATITILGKEHNIDITKLEIEVLEDKGDKQSVEISYDGKEYKVDLPKDIVSKIVDNIPTKSE